MEITYGSCPLGGLWYTCTGQNPTFFGCCTSNPCNGIGCPANDLRAAGMGFGPGPDTGYANDSSYWPNVKCTTGEWYTCAAATPSFQGCCISNPCVSGRCAMGNLFPAQFATVPGSLSTSSVSSSTKTSSSTVSTTAVGASATTTGTHLPSVSPSPNPNIALIAGASAGGAFIGILILLIVAFFVRRCMKKRAAAARITSQEPELIAGGGVTYADKADYPAQHAYAHPKPKDGSTLSPPLTPGPPAYGAQSPRPAQIPVDARDSTISEMPSPRPEQTPFNPHDSTISEMETPRPSPNPNSFRNTHISELDSTGVHELHEMGDGTMTSNWGRSQPHN